MRSVPLLVFANKQDLVGALTSDEIADELNLVGIRDRPWQIQACSATQNEGLAEGMEWLMKIVK
jgi:ADP-ribosylation factor-like protein 3